MNANEAGGVTRVTMTGYGMLAYVAFLAVLLYAIGWVEDLLVPRSIDEGPPASALLAVIIDLVLLAVFAVQHSVMARPSFKRSWTRVVPAAVERSTFVVFATAALALLMWQWRPVPDRIWDLDAVPIRVALYVVSLAGWGLVLVATFAIDHFDLFGVRQVLRNHTGKPMLRPEFRTPLLYRVVRHPLYAGFLLAFWATPTMTVGHLLFAAVTTGYILIAVRLEEHDLIGAFGDSYRDYRTRVPMFVPRSRRVSRSFRPGA
jgi:protein-S-isoprenylcysteine O-methyltransferase Ste14